MCKFCNKEKESLDHLFVKCEFSNNLFNLIKSKNNLSFNILEKDIL